MKYLFQTFNTNTSLSSNKYTILIIYLFFHVLQQYYYNLKTYARNHNFYKLENVHEFKTHVYNTCLL